MFSLLKTPGGLKGAKAPELLRFRTSKYLSIAVKCYSNGQNLAIF